jgi:hypothetical protein
MKAAMRCKTGTCATDPRPRSPFVMRLFGDGSGPNECATRTTQHQPAPMGKMKILGDAIDRRIGGHRRDYDPVLKSHVFDGDRCEEQRLGHGSERLWAAGGGGQQHAGRAVKCAAAARQGPVAAEQSAGGLLPNFSRLLSRLCCRGRGSLSPPADAGRQTPAETAFPPLAPTATPSRSAAACEPSRPPQRRWRGRRSG